MLLAGGYSHEEDANDLSGHLWDHTHIGDSLRSDGCGTESLLPGAQSTDGEARAAKPHHLLAGARIPDEERDVIEKGRAP
jgi:hypothetical protein